jgi:membrane protein YdbS with pleckstrin-like domain
MLLLLHIPVFGLPLAVLVIAIILDQIGRYDLLLHTPVFALPLAVLVIAVILVQIGIISTYLVQYYCYNKYC